MDMPSELTINGVTYVRTDAIEGRTPEQTVERWYSVAELAELSGFTPSSIYRAMAGGRLAYRCPNGSDVGRRVAQSEWERFVATT